MLVFSRVAISSVPPDLNPPVPPSSGFLFPPASLSFNILQMFRDLFINAKRTFSCEVVNFSTFYYDLVHLSPALSLFLSELDDFYLDPPLEVRSSPIFQFRSSLLLH